jgi:hypothetical protein
MPPELIAPELQERLNWYITSWQQSEPASRVDAVESFAFVHGFGEYKGQTIPDFIAAMLNDLLLFLASRPELLSTIETPEATLNKFLKEEEVKINEAARLVALMGSYTFGALDPRYHRAAKEYKKVVQSFRLSDENYNLNLPVLHETQNQ